MSEDWAGFFLRLDDATADRERIRKEYDDVEVTIHPGAAFVCVHAGRPSYRRAPESGMTRLSRSFGEVIDLQISSHGNFHFEHWKDGALARALFWSEGSAWVVEGAPEPWERELWPSGGPKPEATGPTVDPASAAEVIARHYRLPPVTG